MAFHDGLGQRLTTQEPGGGQIDLLRLRADLASVPSFEFALRERVNRLASFRHPSFALVRRVERQGAEAVVTVVSEHADGVRLADLLDEAERRHLPPDLSATLCLIRQLVPSVAILHEAARDVAHGAIAPERLVVTAQARLIVTDYALGSALEQLLYARDRYWTDLRVPLPRAAGLARFDQGADVLQVGVVALSLLLGRRLKDAEHGAALADLVTSARAVTGGRELGPLPVSVQEWLSRALHLDTRGAFPSATEARQAFERVIDDSGHDASPARLDAWLSRLREPVAAPEPLVETTRVAPVNSTLVAPAPVEALAPLATPSSERSAPPVRTFLGADTHDEVAPVEMPVPRSSRRMVAVAAVVVAAVAASAMLALPRLVPPRVAPPAAGQLSVTTDPPGAQASLDGVAQGVTPLSLSVPAGAHVLLVRGADGERTIPLTIAAGAQVAQYIDLPRAAEVPAPTPVAIAVPVVEPAAPAAVPEGPVAGWITVASRFDVQIVEQGALLGTSASDRIMLASGAHALELVNDELGYRASKSVTVPPGKVATVRLDPPTGTLALNATPWAEVTIDGQTAGETPLGNLTLPIGAHDVVFRHPELGERRYRVSVTLKAPARLTADMRAR